MLLTRTDRRRRGNVAILVALCLVPVIGVVAIALDGGVLLDERRHANAVADAAALAAATELFENYPTNAGIDWAGTAARSATVIAALHGYTDDKVTSFVTVNVSPANYQEGPKAGTPVPAGYAEVIVEYRKKRSFSRIWGSSDLPVHARAVARGSFAPSAIGMMALNPTRTNSLLLSGSADLNVSNMAIIVNSNDSAAGSVQSSGRVNVTGGKTYITGGSDTPSRFNPAPITNTPRQPDPLRFLADPPVPSLNRTSEITAAIRNGATTRTIYPGYYSVPTAGWNFDLNSKLIMAGEGATRPDGTVIQPGEANYYFEGGPIRFPNGNEPLESNGGVFIYMKPNPAKTFTPGSDVSTSAIFSMTTDAKMTLSPATSGPYAGMTLFLDRTSKASVFISGNKQVTAKGTWYMPAGHFDIESNGGAVIGNLIADSISISGGPGDTIADFAQPHAGHRIIQLVE